MAYPSSKKGILLANSGVAGCFRFMITGVQPVLVVSRLIRTEGIEKAVGSIETANVRRIVKQKIESAFRIFLLATTCNFRSH